MDRNVDTNMLIDSISSNINSPFFINLLRECWSKYKNIHYIGDLIGEFYTYHMIFKDGNGFEKYMEMISTMYDSIRSLDREVTAAEYYAFNSNKARVIAKAIADRLGIIVTNGVIDEQKEKVRDYFLHEYVENGYVAHSFPDAYYQSIIANGLVSSVDKRSDKPTDIQKIQEMFLKKGILTPLGAYPYYGGEGIYFENNFHKVFQHAVDSPEWFNWFTSADHTTTYHSDIRYSPYILRNKDACRINVEDLCRNAQLSDEERMIVLNFFETNYQKFSKPNLNVALISKSFLGKNRVSTAVPQPMDLLELITYVLNDGAKEYVEHRGNVTANSIPPEELVMTSIPNASEYIQVEEYYRESQSHITDLDTNLGLASTILSNEKLVSSMREPVEQAKAKLQKKKDNLHESTVESFDQRSDIEIQIANQLREKNLLIAEQKSQQKDKEGVKRLLKSNSDEVHISGFINTLSIASLVGFIIGFLVLILSFILSR